MFPAAPARPSSPPARGLGGPGRPSGPQGRGVSAKETLPPRPPPRPGWRTVRRPLALGGDVPRDDLAGRAAPLGHERHGPRFGSVDELLEGAYFPSAVRVVQDVLRRHARPLPVSGRAAGPSGRRR